MEFLGVWGGCIYDMLIIEELYGHNSSTHCLVRPLHYSKGLRHTTLLQNMGGLKTCGLMSNGIYGSGFSVESLGFVGFRRV